VRENIAIIYAFADRVNVPNKLRFKPRTNLRLMDSQSFRNSHAQAGSAVRDAA